MEKIKSRHGKKWVLLVDDDLEVRQTLKELIKVGFPTDLHIIEANNGADATVRINCQMFDCIISDMKMPKKDGRAFITSVRQNGFNNQTPIIVLTGYPDESILEDFRFVYLLKKPFKHQEISDLLTTQLKIGEGSGRIAADTLNRIIESIGIFLKQIAKAEEFSISSPRPKKRGETMGKEYMSRIQFVLDNNLHTFAIMSQSHEIQAIAKKSNFADSIVLNNVARGLGQTILNYSIKRLNLLKMQKIHIESSQGEEIDKFAKERSGIIIPIKSGELELEVLAVVEQLKRSKA